MKSTKSQIIGKGMEISMGLDKKQNFGKDVAN